MGRGWVGGGGKKNVMSTTDGTRNNKRRSSGINTDIRWVVDAPAERAHIPDGVEHGERKRVARQQLREPEHRLRAQARWVVSQDPSRAVLFQSQNKSLGTERPRRKAGPKRFGSCAPRN